MNRLESAVFSKAINYLSGYIKNEEKIQIIEPLTCMIRLAILSYKPKGTKICIYENSIYIQEPGYLQGTMRWLSGDNRNDLHYLLAPISKCLLKWKPTEQEAIKNIYKLSILGLTKLKSGYNCNGCSSLTSHSIDLYINLIKDAINGKNPVEVPEDDDTNNYLFFNKLWSEEQIDIINNLFIEATANKADSDSYLNAIENIVSTKVRCAKEQIVKHMQTIT